MKIMVTGGAGFIGSNLCEAFLERGDEVVCLDNFSTGHYKNIEHFVNNNKFSLIEGDIRVFSVCASAVKDCDIVHHHAALGSVPRSIASPLDTVDTNIGGFVNVLYAAKEAGIKRFVYAASSSTYGDSKKMPKIEHIIGSALSPYAITKYVDELFAKNFSDIYGIETIGLRYFNVFGKNQDPHGGYAAVIPKFVSSLMNYSSPTINGDGTYSRDFTYIKNVLQANILASSTPGGVITEKIMEYNSSQGIDEVPGENISEVFNVACGVRTTLNELADTLNRNLSEYDSRISTVPVKHAETREGDIPHSLASIEKIAAVLGYSPEYSVEDGLKEACKWYYDHLR